MQTNVATPSKPTIITAWDLQEGCHSNTLLQDDTLRIYAERKYYAVCQASLDHAMNCRKNTFRVGVRQNGAVRWLGFAWSGTNQSRDWLKEIAEHLVEDAWADFQEMEDIEVEIKWPEKFSKTREYRPSGMSAREMIEEAGFEVPAVLARYIARKGSVTVDGVSLTVNGASGTRFDVNLVPHTLEVTILGGYRPGSRVNLEVDIVARYLERLVAETR